MFSSRNNWSKALDNVLGTKTSNRRCGIQNFDSRIVPNLLYDSETWGYKSRNQIEKVHLRFCKEHVQL